MSRRRLTAVTALLLVMSLSSCRQKQPPELREFDEQATPAEADALAALAPPWTTPERATLDNGLLVHWLAEDGSPAVHLRLVLPLRPIEGVSAAALVSAGQALALEVEQQAASYAADVFLVNRPGRIELSIHAQDLHFAALMRALGRTLGRPPNARTLERGQQYMVDWAPAPRVEELALSELVTRLTGRARAQELVTPDEFAALDGAALRAAWDALLDPRRSLLVVHAGHGSKREEASAELGALAAAWRRGDEPTATEDAHARLAIGPASGSGGGFLLGEQRAPLHVLESDASGAPVLIFGRVIPTTSPRDRSLARLAQRLLQERLDARLAIVGDTAQLIVVLPLRGNPRRLSSGALELLGLEGDDDERGDAPAGGAIGQQLERFQKIIRARPPPQRMFQTAELWLGARMVEASLRGEDWTALWTLAIDLSREDQEIAGALARDARGMLDATPEQLLAWQKRWLDPGAGERGWTWVAAGDPKRLAPFLDALGDVERVQVTTR